MNSGLSDFRRPRVTQRNLAGARILPKKKVLCCFNLVAHSVTAEIAIQSAGRQLGCRLSSIFDRRLTISYQSLKIPFSRVDKHYFRSLRLIRSERRFPANLAKELFNIHSIQTSNMSSVKPSRGHDIIFDSNGTMLLMNNLYFQTSLLTNQQCSSLLPRHQDLYCMLSLFHWS